MKNLIYTGLTSVLLSSSISLVLAQEQPSPESIKMSHMVVVANKSPRPIEDVVGSIVSFSANDIANNQAENMDGLLRYQPNIKMESAGNRFQSTTINIRGIGGNRVAVRVDGIPSTDQFDVGHFGNSGKLLPELDLIKQVEILKGPASTLYGSDAIGGVVSFETWDPSDLVSQTKGDDFYKLRVGYEGESRSQVATGIAAWQGDKVGTLLSMTHRQGKGINNDHFVGDAVQDKLDWDSDSLFAKATMSLAQDDLLTLILSHSQTDNDSENNSLLGVGRTFATTTQLSGSDSTESDRISMEYEFSSDLALFEENVFRVYFLNSETKQDTVQFLNSRGSDIKRDKRFNYEQTLWGMEFNSFAQLGIHNIVTGFDFNQTKSEEFRDGSQTTLSTGEVTKTVLGETFPVRDFPKSKTLKFGVFTQDEIQLNSQWTVVPALRFDYYHLKPSADSIYSEDNPTNEIASITETAFSPKLGILRHFDNNVSAYAQYARGYRAAPFEDANIGLDIIAGPTHIRALPNPDLKSETSNGFEIGVRQGKGGRHMNASIFYNRYKNFIETKSPLGPDPSDPSTLLFQSRNLTNAEIYGVELSYEIGLQNWSESLSAWTLATNLAVTEGNDLDTDEPINTIAPAQAIINLGWHSSDQKWQVNLVNTLTKAKTRVDDSKVASSGSFIKPAGSAIFDLLAHYQITKNSDIRFGVFNLTNKEYWRWQDVMGLTHDQYDSVIQSLTRPERNVSLSFSHKW